MARCIKCGKETQSVHEYYTADKVGESTDVRNTYVGGQSGTQTTTTTSYANFEYHQEFVCKRHDIKLLLVSMLFGASFFMGFLAYASRLGSEGLLFWILFCITLLPILIAGYALVGIITGNGIMQSNIAKRKNNNNGQKAVFSRKAYEALKRNNNMPL